MNDSHPCLDYISVKDKSFNCNNSMRIVYMIGNHLKIVICNIYNQLGKEASDYKFKSNKMIHPHLLLDPPINK